MDLLDAATGLGPNLFYAKGLAVCLFAPRQRKPPKLRNKIVITNGAKEVRNGRAQNEIRPTTKKTRHARRG